MMKLIIYIVIVLSLLIACSSETNVDSTNLNPIHQENLETNVDSTNLLPVQQESQETNFDSSNLLPVQQESQEMNVDSSSLHPVQQEIQETKVDSSSVNSIQQENQYEIAVCPIPEEHILREFFDIEDFINEIYAEKANNPLCETFIFRDLNEFYVPLTVPSELQFDSIAASVNYVTLRYYEASSISSSNEITEYIPDYTFTWMTNMDADVAMKNLHGREVIENGVTYFINIWPQRSEKPYISVDWIVDGKAFQARLPVDFDDTEIIEFCSLKAINLTDMND